MFSPPRMIISFSRPVMWKQPSGAHGGQIAGVQPAFGIDGARRGLGLAIVALHHQVAARAQLAALARSPASRHCRGATIFTSVSGSGAAHGGHANLQRIVRVATS